MQTYHIHPAGTLSVTPEGAYLHFRADAPMSGGLLRLWLIGEGRCGQLGLMTPHGGRLHLDRRMSRRELTGFPQVIERAELSERRPAEPDPAQPEVRAEGALGDTVWHRNQDGSLSAEIGGRHYIALPSSLRRPAPCSRMIDGREYVIFPAPHDCQTGKSGV